MFRGGRVSSYGTGIASGLADGGRVGFYRGGSGSYDPTLNKQGMVLGSDLINFIDQNPKLGGLEYFDTLNPKQYYKPTTYGGSRRGPQITDSPEFLKLFQNYMDPDSAIIDQDSVSGTVEYPIGKGGEASEGEISTNKGGTSNVENSAENAENNPGENIDLTNTDDDPTDVGEKDLESMISRYEKILGGKKAFGQDVSDMLLGFAGAKGDTVMEKFQDFAATESKKGPSRTEKIKQAAGMLGIKGEQAKEIAALQATGKLYAPGITQKTAMYIKSLPKGSAEHATALAQIKWPPTLDRKIAEDQMSGPVSIDDIDVYAGVYINNYKGKLVEGAVSGVYLNPTDSTLVSVDDQGQITNTKQLNIK